MATAAEGRIAQGIASAPHVLDMGDRLEVSRVHARVVAAEVIEHHTDRERAALQKPRHSVGDPNDGLAVTEGTDADRAVAPAVRRAGPDPAPAHWLGADLREEACSKFGDVGGAERLQRRQAVPCSGVGGGVEE